MTREKGSGGAAPAVRHRPQHAPNALADYVQRTVDALAPPVAPPASAEPQKRRRKRPQKLHTPRSAPPGDSTGDGFAVSVRNLLDPAELEDDDEYADAIADLPADLGRFGAVVALAVDRRNGEVTVTYGDQAHAAACVAAMDERTYGGRMVSAVVANRPSSERPSPHEEAAVAPAVVASPLRASELPPKPRRKRRSKIKSAVVRVKPPPQEGTDGLVAVAAGRCVVVVRNMVEADEVEDGDEYDDAVAEVTAALGRHGDVAAVHICREPSRIGDGDLAQRRVGDVVVEYATEDAARLAVDALSGAKYGGRTLECELVPSSSLDVIVVVDGMLDANELDDDDEFEDVREEVESFFRAVLDVAATEIMIARTSGQVTVHFRNRQDASAAAKSLGTKSYGGRQLIVNVHLPRIELTTQITQLVHKSTARSTQAPAVLISDDLVALLTVFLQRLASLQERAHIQNPLQDKRSRRLVLGLHEVRRGVLTGKIKLLLLATDFDSCDVLDEKLDEIVLVATRENIPTIRALTRRKLGKVLNKHARVSCVGVYSYDGANDQFRAIIQEQERLNRAAKKGISSNNAD